jgi:hypothetical protein
VNWIGLFSLHIELVVTKGEVTDGHLQVCLVLFLSLPITYAVLVAAACLSWMEGGGLKAIVISFK